MCAVASGSWGGQRPSLASYVAVTGPTGGATASPEVVMLATPYGIGSPARQNEVNRCDRAPILFVPGPSRRGLCHLNPRRPGARPEAGAGRVVAGNRTHPHSREERRRTMKVRGLSWPKVLLLLVAVVVGMGAWLYTDRKPWRVPSPSHPLSVTKRGGTPLNEPVRLFDAFHDGLVIPSGPGGEAVTIKGPHLICAPVLASACPENHLVNASLTRLPASNATKSPRRVRPSIRPLPCRSVRDGKS